MVPEGSKCKVLIAVVCNKDKIYDKFYKAAHETWDSVNVDGVSTIYYYGNGDNTWDGNTYYTNQSEAYDCAHLRTREMLKEVLKLEWDILFRTGLSSYIDKRGLLDVCSKLPKERLYAGHSPSGDFVSGTGIFLSRDTAKILSDNVDHVPTPADDCHYSEVMQRMGVELDASPTGGRMDFTDGHLIDLKPTYHYRIKSIDREKDIQLMYELHNLINK